MTFVCPLCLNSVYGTPVTEDSSGTAMRLKELEDENKKLRVTLEYIRDNSSKECNCYREEAVNYFEPCLHHAAKDALEKT